MTGTRGTVKMGEIKGSASVACVRGDDEGGKRPPVPNFSNDETTSPDFALKETTERGGNWRAGRRETGSSGCEWESGTEANTEDSGH